MQQGLEEQLISNQQLADYNHNGYLVLERFIDEADCDQLRTRAEELVHDFDPAEVVSIFSDSSQRSTPERPR